MTTIYFVRHAEPNYKNQDDATRELTTKGLEDRKLVTKFLNDKNINVILSSPYKRSIDTIKDFADNKGLKIRIIEDFKERRITSEWIDDFNSFSKKQWEDFNYKFLDGESLSEVQMRNINALRKVLKEYSGQNIVIGTHGTALSTIINYFDESFDYTKFEEIKSLMPWIVKFTFDYDKCLEIAKYNLI